MNYTTLVMKTTLRNNFRWQVVAMIIFGIIMICVVGVTALFVSLLINPEIHRDVPDVTALRSYLGLILFITSFCSVGIYSSVFAGQSLIREKTRGNIQALLATPVSPLQTCIGKTLGTFIPGYLFTVVLTIIIYILINVAYFVPVTGFLGNPWMFISNLVGVPLIFLFLVLLVNLVGITGKAATGNLIGQIPLSVLPALLINLSIHTSIKSDAWLFTIVLLGMAAVAGIPAWVLSRKLSTEAIILSQ